MRNPPQHKNKRKVSVLIPCHNEEEGIGRVINGVPVERLSDLGFTTEIIVIDNNSTDKTAEISESLGVRVVYEEKRGKGNALRTGFNSISPDTDFVVMLDGDNTYKSAEIPRLIEPLTSGFCDVVVGSRLGGKIAHDALRIENRIVNWAFTFLVRQFYKANVTDVLSGFFAWDKDVVDVLKINLSSEGFSIEMEMITKIVKLGFEVYSVPITYDLRKGQTKISAFRDGIEILKMFGKNIFWWPKAISNIAPIPSPIANSTLSIVIPALNEEAGIQRTIEQIPLHELKQLGYSVEIIVVDNGSTDKTAELSRQAGAKVVSQPLPGYGNAYKMGFSKAKGQIIATGDADTTYPFDKLPTILATMRRGGFDFVNTDRLSNLGPDVMTVSHIFGNWFLSLGAKILFRLPFRDSQSGMWVFKRSILSEIELQSAGMAFSQELKIAVYKNGFKCGEVPIQYRARTGKVKLNTIRDGVGNTLHLCKMRLDYWRPTLELIPEKQLDYDGTFN